MTEVRAIADEVGAKVMFDAAQTLQAVDAGQDFKIIYEDMQFAPEATPRINAESLPAAHGKTRCPRGPT